MNKTQRVAEMEAGKIDGDSGIESTELGRTLKFINQFIEHGDITKVCKKLGYDKGNLSRMLKGEIGPRFDVLKELKKIADQNHAKLT